MGSFKFEGINEYSKQLEKLGVMSVGVCKYALYDAARIMCDELYKATPVRTGQAREHMIINRMKDKNGVISVNVSWPGYDDKTGVPNPVKINVKEGGASRRRTRTGALNVQRKQPFISQTMRSIEPALNFTIGKALDEKIEEIMRKG